MTAAPAGLARALRIPWAHDVILGLLIVAVLPLAIVAIPNTISVVAALLPPHVLPTDMVRAHGLALPAMMVTVPLAAVVIRRLKAPPLLVGGLTLLALADIAGGFADSVFMVGALRVAHGVGAGLLIPATLVAVWGRAPQLKAVWAAMLAISMVSAQALALWPLDDVDTWRVTLQPYPMLTGIALALAAVYLVVWLSGGEGDSGHEPAAAERGRLLLAAVPAAVIGVVALGATFDWAPDVVSIAALVSLVTLLGLAATGTFDGVAGRTTAFTMVAVGVVILPTSAQVTNMELGGLGGPGLSGLWLPFALAGLAGLVVAVSAARAGQASMSRLGAAGLLTVVVGLCAVRLLVPAEGGMTLLVPYGLLAAGAAVALVAALRTTGVGAALFALSLCFPAMLAGFLLGSGFQLSGLRAATTPQALVDALVSAMWVWALAAGFLVVLVIVLGALLARRRPARPGTAGEAGGVAGSDGEVAAAVLSGAESRPVAPSDGRTWPVVPSGGESQTATVAEDGWRRAAEPGGNEPEAVPTSQGEPRRGASFEGRSWPSVPSGGESPRVAGSEDELRRGVPFEGASAPSGGEPWRGVSFEGTSWPSVPSGGESPRVAASEDEPQPIVPPMRVGEDVPAEEAEPPAEPPPVSPPPSPQVPPPTPSPESPKDD
ncbi:hypothetical protein [Streptosporangium sp. KLBMP 9127]|nr:hypothetical protein [Streptosporangium sp. KLBMP 9127]